MNAILQPNQPLSSNDFVEDIFTVFELRFRNLWIDSFGGLSRTEVKKCWHSDLEDLTPRELKRGIDASKGLEFPPTLGKFRNLCKPPLEYEALFNHALTQLRLREEGLDRWVNAAVYWAAVKMTYEMRNNPYDRVKNSWKRALDAAYEGVRKGVLPNEIPVKKLALPAPGKSVTTQETGRKKMMGIKKFLNME